MISAMKKLDTKTKNKCLISKLQFLFRVHAIFGFRQGASYIIHDESGNELISVLDNLDWLENQYDLDQLYAYSSSG